jgi:SAM-dependent methyltransferase
VLAAESIHWFDLDRFFAEARRVLKPGGVLAAVGYVWFYVDPVVDEVVARRLIRALEPHWKPGHWLLHDGYKTIPFPGEEIRISPCAIHLMWTREQVEAFVGSWSPVQRFPPQRLAEAFAELADVWPDGEPRRVVMPVSSRVCRL